VNLLRRLFSDPASVAADKARWVVVDCESSGLDPHADNLLSIGAIALDGARIAVDAGFSVVLLQENPSDAWNIAIHGISGGEQRAGLDYAHALRRFDAFADQAPLVAFHAEFDQTLIARAARVAGIRMHNRWLDLAALAPALYPKESVRCRTLDNWLDCFGILNPARHDALGDAYATAQLFQVLLSASRAQGSFSAREIFRIAESRRWLAG